MYGIYGRNGQFPALFVDCVDWDDPSALGGQNPVKLLKFRLRLKVIGCRDHPTDK